MDEKNTNTAFPFMPKCNRQPVPCPPPGVYRVPFDEYASWDALNNSTIGEFHASAASGAQYMKVAPKPTPAMLFGNPLHSAALEPELFNRDAVDLDIADAAKEKTRNEAAEKWASKHETDYLENKDNPEFVHITAPIFLHRGWRERIESMLATIRENPNAKWIIDGGADLKELSIVWDDVFMVVGVEKRIRCKCRVDLFVSMLPDPINMPSGTDIKTTKSARYDDFQRSISDFGYHRQAAWYLRGMFKSGLIQQMHERSWMILAVEKTPPFLNAMYTLLPRSIEQGLDECRTAARAYIKYRETGHAPGLPQTPRCIGLSKWKSAPDNQALNVNITGKMI